MLPRIERWYVVGVNGRGDPPRDPRIHHIFPLESDSLPPFVQERIEAEKEHRLTGTIGMLTRLADTEQHPQHPLSPIAHSLLNHGWHASLEQVTQETRIPIEDITRRVGVIAGVFNIDEAGMLSVVGAPPPNGKTAVENK